MRWRLLLCALLWATSAQCLTLTLTWDAPAVGVPETYLIYRQLDGGLYELLAGTEAPTTVYTDGSVPTGQVCYVVSAVNSAGESPPSTAACFPSDGPTTAPQHLRLAP